MVEEIHRGSGRGGAAERGEHGTKAREESHLEMGEGSEIGIG